MTSRTDAMNGGLVVVSGPSGSGKTTIVHRLAERLEVDVAVTATTRPPRPGEIDGEHYHFLDEARFRQMISDGAFVEHKEVFGNGNLYGSLKQPLEDALRNKDRIYLLEIDVEGGLDLISQGYAGAYVFIEPPSMDELRRRIENRGTETPESITQRIAKAEIELSQKDRYNHVVVNDDLDRTYDEVCALLGLPATCVETNDRNDETSSSGNRGSQEVR